MGHKKKKNPYFIVEIDGKFRPSGIHIQCGDQLDSLDTPRKAYLYQGDSRKVAIGFSLEKALRFLSAELAIEYINRNNIYRSILPFVKIERCSGDVTRRRVLPN